MPNQQQCAQCKRLRWITPRWAPYCTRTCQRAAAAGAPSNPRLDITVFCCVCAQAHHATSPTVHYRSADRRWWCADEIGCWSRARAADTAREARAAELAAMYRALESVWDQLETQGWRI